MLYRKVGRDLDIVLRSGRPLVFNPGALGVSASKDFIGRISRQSRRISFKRTRFQLRLLQVYLLKTRYVLSTWRKKQHQWESACVGTSFLQGRVLFYAPKFLCGVQEVGRPMMILFALHLGGGDWNLQAALCPLRVHGGGSFFSS